MGNTEELAYLSMLLIKNFVITAGEHVIPGTVLFRQWKHKVKFHPGENVSWLKGFYITFAHLNTLSPRSDQHQISLCNIYSFLKKSGHENKT